ncbi:MAG TPA: hypothetical protein DCE23_01085, partial [Firmicutes bacterium]|nr:hypothetical protein [Bacillota bacterium]
MKKKIVVLALIVTLLCSGCGKKIPTLSNGDEAVITLKNGSMISVNELYEKVKDDYALSALVDMVDKKILEDKFDSKKEDANKYVNGQMTSLENYYGDDLENQIQTQAGFASIDAYKDYLYLNYLKNEAVVEYAKTKIDDKSIEKYYRDEIVSDIKLSHILITPNVTDSMTDEEKEKADTEAKEKAEAIIAELNKTEKSAIADKFAELAKEQSMDESSKENGGSLGFVNKATLSSQYAKVSEAAYKLKDGEYSKEVVKSEIGYHVILRVETNEKASLEDVKDDILDALSSDYLDKNMVAYLDGLVAIREEYDFEIVDTELKKQYKSYLEKQRAAYQQQQNNKDQ